MKSTTQDTFYTSYLGMRSVPLKVFVGTSSSAWVLPITSLNEDRLLKEMGVPRIERNQIEGLVTLSSTQAETLTEEKQISRAIVRLAANPPAQVGALQRRTSRWLLRP
jgi:hypothetical protein